RCTTRARPSSPAGRGRRPSTTSPVYTRTGCGRPCDRTEVAVADRRIERGPGGGVVLRLSAEERALVRQFAAALRAELDAAADAGPGGLRLPDVAAGAAGGGAGLGPDDLDDPAPVALPVQLEKQDALPGSEAELAVADRDRLTGCAEQHRHAVRVPVAEVHV